MKEIKTILQELERAHERGLRAALATVVNVYGSSYRRTGARMLIREDGRWFGSVSGGCLEGDIIENAKQVIADSKSELYRYDTRQNAENSFGMGYGCNGMLEILIEPIAASSSDAGYEILRQLVREPNQQGLSTVFYSEHPDISIGTRVHSKDRVADAVKKELTEKIQNDAEKVVQSGESKAITYKFDNHKVKVFHELFEPNINILVYGAVFHVIPLMKICDELGYNVHVTDSFEPIQPIWNFPNAGEIKIKEHEEVQELIRSTPKLAVVFLTHNFFYIKEELPKVLRSSVPYVGILGSRKKTQKILREAEVNESSFNSSELGKLHYPIGLDIGANTPEEIALSIIAEIKTFFTGHSGVPLKEFEGYIHKKHLRLTEEA